MRALAILSLLFLSGCTSDDKGQKPYEAALAAHRAALEAGKPPADPAYDVVLVELARVPQSSQFRGRADALKKAIESARLELPSSPLARGTGPAESPEVRKQRARCEDAARAVGTASATEKPRRLDELQQCQQALERLLARHPELGGADGGSFGAHDH